MHDDEFTRQYFREATLYRLADQFILLRKKRNLTQKDLAMKAGTTQTVISRLENITVNPSFENVIKIAEAMNAIVEVHLIPLEEVKRTKQTTFTANNIIKELQETECSNFETNQNIRLIDISDKQHGLRQDKRMSTCTLEKPDIA